MFVRAFHPRPKSVRCRAGLWLGWLAALTLAGCVVQSSRLSDHVRVESLSPVPTVPTVKPTPPASSTPTPTQVPSPTPSLTAAGAYDIPEVHADGRYELQLAGTRVAAVFTTSGSPVEHWAREVLLPLFTVPEQFRPSYPILRTVEGWPVHADGTPDAARMAPHRFLLRVEPDGTVDYVDDARVEGAGYLAYVLHTVWDTAPPPPAAPTFTPTPPPLPQWPTPTPTFVHAIPSPTPFLTVSGTYDNQVEHADGHYVLELSGSRVAANFSTSRSPVQYWAREVAAPLFTVPEPFRPPYPVLRTAVGRAVRADGTLDPDHPEPRRFLLQVEPDGTVDYLDDAQVEGEGQQAYCLNLVGLTGVGIVTGSLLRPPAGIATGTLRAPAGAGQPPPPSRCAASSGHAGRFLAYNLYTTWGTTPAANDRAVLEILDRYWFGETLLSAEPPPVQFKVPEHSEIKGRTFPAAHVGAFVIFDADGRVTALGAPANEPKAGAGAPVYNFHSPLLPELGQLHQLEHLDLGYRTYFDRDAKERVFGRGPKSLTGAIPPQLWRLPRLRHLDLQGQLLAWTLPSDIGRLASLEYLDLSNNWLSGPLPPELGHLASLKYLDLGSNNFTGPLPPEWGRLANLTVLRLQDNQLSGPLPPTLGQLTNLEWMDLSGSPSVGNNQLSGPLPPELGHLASLKYLDLGSNDFTGPLPPEWGRLANLAVLRLQDNQLSGPLPPTLGQLANLEWMDLSGSPSVGNNQLMGPLPPELGQLANLKYLDLSYNQLTGSLPSEWGQLANLQRFFLHDNQLTGPLPPEWGQLANLQQLGLSVNQLTGPLPPKWGQLANLQRLLLYDNQLTGPLPPEWGQLAANLYYLDVRENQLIGCFPFAVPYHAYLFEHDLPSCSPPVEQE